jgi:hypothetical protein
MNNGSRSSRMKSLGVPAKNFSTLVFRVGGYGGPNERPDRGKCDYCWEGNVMVNESQTNGCLSGNNNSSYCINFRERMRNVFIGCRNIQNNWANQNQCDRIIGGIY